MYQCLVICCVLGTLSTVDCRRAKPTNLLVRQQEEPKVVNENKSDPNRAKIEKIEGLINALVEKDKNSTTVDKSERIDHLDEVASGEDELNKERLENDRIDANTSIEISARADGRNPVKANRGGKERVDTYDDHYYDWGFAPNIFPGVGPLDARVEGTTTTDIACWDVDEKKDGSPILVRCDYSMDLNTSLSPKGFSCIQYQVSLGEKIFNKASCAYAPSSVFEPCEDIVRNTQPPAKVKNCRVCWGDGCNADNEKSIPVRLVFLLLAALACCFCLLAAYVMVGKNYKTCCCGPTDEFD